MGHSQEVLTILGSYVLGCFCAGYYLVRWYRGTDIRDHGSRSVGARNVGRVLGVSGFALTLAADVGKGVAAVAIAQHLQFGRWAVMSAMLAVTVGHVWPAQLRFRGGKGVATSLGALLTFDYPLLIGFLLIFGVAFATLRRFTLSGLFAFAMLPLAAMVLGRTETVTSAVLLLALIVLIAHRPNIAAIATVQDDAGVAEAENRPAPRGIPQ